MLDEKPKDMTVALRQIGECFKNNCMIQGFPQWFQGEYNKSVNMSWANLLFDAANELEQMQQLNGRLIKRLAGD